MMFADVKTYVIKGSLVELACAAISGGLLGSAVAQASNEMLLRCLAWLGCRAVFAPGAVVADTAVKLLIIESGIFLAVCGASAVRRPRDGRSAK